MFFGQVDKHSWHLALVQAFAFFFFTFRTFSGLSDWAVNFFPLPPQSRLPFLEIQVV